MKITDTHVYFYSGKEIFSNWHTSPNQIHDPIASVAFDSSEQGFMYYKADFFGDIDTALEIVREINPKTAKELGRKVQGFEEELWECVRLGFMTYVNLLKYRQNDKFALELLQTENRILVEASPYDKIWGVGLGADDPLILDKKNWKGKNLLGVALMKVRELIK